MPTALPCGLRCPGPAYSPQERSTEPGRFVGLELQLKLLMAKANTAPFVLKHGPESAASGLYPQPTETCLPITWAMSCLPQRFTLTYTHTHHLTAHPNPLRTHTHTPAETVISMVINCGVPLRLIERVSEGGGRNEWRTLFDVGWGCVCQALGWVLLCKHSCVSSCSCVLICLGFFHTNNLDCAFF